LSKYRHTAQDEGISKWNGQGKAAQKKNVDVAAIEIWFGTQQPTKTTQQCG
jgi:hypothetical protein